MHDNKEKLVRTGCAVLEASKNELFVAMRFLDIALNSLGYEMDLSMRSIGTDSEDIRFNPLWLVENYRNDSVLVNRAYLHMLLHCVFRHMFHNEDKDEALWDLSCDIAVTSIIDDMKYRCVSLTVPDERQAMYDRLHEQMKVLTAEGIYKALKKRPPAYLEMEKLKKFFTVDDHVFWDSKKDDEKDDDQKDDQEQQEKKEEKWQEILSKMRTNIETFSRDATDLAAGLYDYIRVETRQRYDYRQFLRKFTTLREEIRLDLDSFDYIYYMYGLERYGNMPLIEPLEYKESEKIEELAIVIDTSESCSGDTVRRFLEETFAILTDKENFFDHMNVHIIQCDIGAQKDDLITCEADMRRFMESFQVIGFGGTDFRPAFEYVNKLCEDGEFRNLRGLLYFTDGYGQYPVGRPEYQTAFIYFEENYYDRQVPPWAIKLIIGPDELQEVTR